jgi:DNA-binding LytR/AlgR family response regulator
MTTILIEDEYPAAERLEKLIRKIDPQIQILGVLQSIEAAKEWFAINPAPDLIFSDIQLSDGLSFQIFETISIKSPIIFTTSYDEYAIKAFRVKSIDYLLKPIKEQELQAAIDKFKNLKKDFAQNASFENQYALKIESLIDSIQITGKKYKSRFLVTQGEQLLPIDNEQIAYFFTSNEMVCLVRKDNKQFLIDYTLEELEQCLDPAVFFRLNRQFIANISSINKIHTYFNNKLKLELMPAPTQDVLVSREKAQSFKKWVEGI